MKEYTPDGIRNVALVGHGGSGKTAIAEAMAFATGITTRMGKTDEGNTISDFDAEETRRGISVNVSVIPIEHSDHKLNILDTPGYADFVGDTLSGIQAADGAVVVVDAVAGVEVGTELVWEYLDERHMPRLVCVTKMNRDNAQWRRALTSLQSTFKTAKLLPIQAPIGQEHGFRGVVDVLSGKALLGPEGKAGPVPEDVRDVVEELKEPLVEAAAESDDDLLMKFLEGESLSDGELRRGLQMGVRAGTVAPVLFGASTEGIGVRALMDVLITLLPSPAEAQPRVAKDLASSAELELKADSGGPLAALVFKTLADPYVGKITLFRVFSGGVSGDSRAFNPRAGEEERIGPVHIIRGKDHIHAGRVPAGDIGGVAKLAHTITGDTLSDRTRPLVIPTMELPQPLYSVALTPATQGDSAKLGPALAKLVEEDPSLHWQHEPSTRELLLSGMGDAHIDVAVHRLKGKFGVGVTTAVPRVPYRETISQTSAAQYRHKKQTGGAGQFAEVHLRVEPLERGKGFEYVNAIFGGAISRGFIPSIEKGIKEVMEHGVVAGYPVVDVQAAVYDGKEHPVDSKDIAFQIAGREVFKLAVQSASPVLLEPIYNLRIVAPAAQMGDILGDLNSRRAMVQGTEQQAGKVIVTAQAPLAEFQRYSTDLRSMTQGRGYYSMEFSHYAEVPQHLMQEIIAASRRDGETK